MRASPLSLAVIQYTCAKLWPAQPGRCRAQISTEIRLVSLHESTDGPVRFVLDVRETPRKFGKADFFISVHWSTFVLAVYGIAILFIELFWRRFPTLVAVGPFLACVLLGLPVLHIRRRIAYRAAKQSDGVALSANSQGARVPIVTGDLLSIKRLHDALNRVTAGSFPYVTRRIVPTWIFVDAIVCGLLLGQQTGSLWERSVGIAGLVALAGFVAAVNLPFEYYRMSPQQIEFLRVRIRSHSLERMWSHDLRTAAVNIDMTNAVLEFTHDAGRTANPLRTSVFFAGFQDPYEFAAYVVLASADERGPWDLPETAFV